MSTKKTAILLIIAAVIALSAVGIFFSISNVRNSSESYLSIMGMGCDAMLYEQESEVGYLTMTNGDKEFTARVDNAELQNALATAKLENIIGANVGIAIPDKILQEKHISIENTDDINDYFYSGAFDDYLVLLDVSYK